jgi:3-dehydroquinate synthase
MPARLPRRFAFLPILGAVPGRAIWLVGMMGAGKSTLGPALARKLRRRFVDADHEIERAAGAKVAALFEREGEAGFRARERALQEQLAESGAVVALGGGAIAQPGAAERLAASGLVVYLRARPETLLARLGDASERPLLAGLSPGERKARLEALLAERKRAYETASIVLDTDDGAPEALAAELARRVRARAEGPAEPARRVEVALPGRSYAVEIEAGSLATLGARVAQVLRARQALVVTSPPIGRRYAAAALRSLRAAGLETGRIDVPDGDRSKSLRQAARLYDALLAKGADRDSVLVALGGGVVGDLTGFVAATFLRGIPFVQVPTSLLAMVDSSVGGKTGVNLPQGKNLVGAFHQPSLVVIDPTVLQSLPPRERAAGFAEVIKKAAIRDASLFATLERDAEALRALELPRLAPVIERAVAIKAEVVGEDERERDQRMLLNYGHTLGHAIEALLGFRGLLHGEAVAIGMVFAARLSEKKGRAPSGTADRLEALCRRFGLPVAPPARPRRAYLAALRVDKKSRNSRIRFVVLEGIGRAGFLTLRPEEIAAELPAGAAPRRARRRRA